MSGIGNPDNGLRLITDSVSLPSTIDEILDKLRQILLMGKVQRVTLDVNGRITYDRYAGDDELKGVGDFASASIIDFVQNVDMEEVTLEIGDLPVNVLVRMWRMLESARMTASFLVLSDAGSLFWEWMGIREVEMGETFWGAQVVKDADLNRDVFLVCGAIGKYAGMSDIVRVLKGSAG